VRSVIAFLSDFGLRDSYVGIVKGVLASLVQDPFIIDITHDVPPHDILRGAYILGCSHTFFPVGTVFLCVVDPGVGTERAGLVVCVGDRVFVAPDNGLLSEIFHRCKGWKAYRIETERFAAMPRLSSTFHARDVFAPVAARIACGMDPSESGPSHLHPVILDLPVPNREKDALVGEVIYDDRFGNLITNLDYQEVTSFLEGHAGVVEVGGVICPIVQTYSDVPAGSLLALMGSDDRLEVAVSEGSALHVLGLGRGSKVLLRRR